MAEIPKVIHKYLQKHIIYVLIFFDSLACFYGILIMKVLFELYRNSNYFNRCYM